MLTGILAALRGEVNKNLTVPAISTESPSRCQEFAGVEYLRLDERGGGSGVLLL
jgi:hypothetical protein